MTVAKWYKWYLTAIMLPNLKEENGWQTLTRILFKIKLLEEIMMWFICKQKSSITDSEWEEIYMENKHLIYLHFWKSCFTDDFPVCVLLMEKERFIYNVWCMAVKEIIINFSTFEISMCRDTKGGYLPFGWDEDMWITRSLLSDIIHRVVNP